MSLFVEQLPPAVAGALRALVDEYRGRCLWFLRSDYYPATVQEGLQVIAAIERHGDREAFQKAGALRTNLIPSGAESS